MDTFRLYPGYTAEFQARFKAVVSIEKFRRRMDLYGGKEAFHTIFWLKIDRNSLCSCQMLTSFASETRFARVISSFHSRHWLLDNGYWLIGVIFERAI
jgi:hypothetical protein